VVTSIQSIVGSAQLEVRVGYFGICANNGGDWLCSNNATALSESYNMQQDPLNLIWVAKTFKDNIVFPYLMYVQLRQLQHSSRLLTCHRIVAIILAFVCFILLATFPGWHEEQDEETGSEIDVKPFPSRAVCQVALALVFVAAIFVLVSVLWQHTASVAAASVTEDFGNGSVHSGVGTSAMVLGWFGFVLLITVAIGLLFILLSMSILDRLTGSTGT